MSQTVKPKGSTVYYIDSKNKIQTATLAEDFTVTDRTAYIHSEYDIVSCLDLNEVWFTKTAARKAVQMLDMVRSMHENDNNEAIISAIVQKRNS